MLTLQSGAARSALRTPALRTTALRDPAHAFAGNAAIADRTAALAAATPAIALATAEGKSCGAACP